MSVTEVVEQKKEVKLCQTVKKLRRKIVLDYDQIAEAVRVWRRLGHKIVMTIGTWDLYHIGHARYITAASEFGDIIVVGVDSDRAVKLYKDPGRPAVPEAERMEALCYLPVDLVTLMDDVTDDGKWQYGLLRVVEPDVFVAVEESYPEWQLKEISENGAKEVVILPRQAETSTSNMIRNLIKNNLMSVIEKVKDAL
jgi:cytidyltransferase-like protein